MTEIVSFFSSRCLGRCRQMNEPVFPFQKFLKLGQHLTNYHDHRMFFGYCISIITFGFSWAVCIYN